MTEDYTKELSAAPLLAETEEEMMRLLNKEQCEAIALWLKLYGDAFGAASATCGHTVRTNFSYAASRLEIMGKSADRSVDV